jgi:acyl-CoA dehydrogenase
METMDDLLTEAFERLLREQCRPDVIRDIESGASVESLWSVIEESGFADAMLPEEAGGAGLDLAQAFALIELCGRHALPVPLAQTMVARALIAAAGGTPPAGSIAIARAERDDRGRLVARAVSYGKVADWALVEQDGDAVLIRIETREPHIFPLDATLIWPATAASSATTISLTTGIRTWEACLLSAQLAGAMLTIFERTLLHANDRQQFGRPIGKFQAIQHQLSVMAEQVFAARMAAQIGCRTTGVAPALLAVAAAKARTSEAAFEVAAIAHAVHGAIGFTAEFDLQLFTRRLHAWRQAAGSESFWHHVLGNALVAQNGGTTLDLLRDLTDTK